jgi:hypothetical protein
MVGLLLSQREEVLVWQIAGTSIVRIPRNMHSQMLQSSVWMKFMSTDFSLLEVSTSSANTYLSLENVIAA